MSEFSRRRFGRRPNHVSEFATHRRCFRAIHTTTQSELADAEFLMWRTLQRFEVFRWVPPLIGYDLIEFARDAIPHVIVKSIEIPSRRIG
jgi:hypothetical protein